MARSFRALGAALARAADEKKGEQVLLLNVGKTSPVADFMLIVTANSRPHLDALEVEIEKAAAALKARPIRQARPRSDQWRVLDFGGLLVHLMSAEAREFYGLEKLYHEAPKVAWQSARKSHARAR